MSARDGACDRCHRDKERCSATGDDCACRRCVELNIACTRSRIRPRRGRRPKAHAFANGTHIAAWDSQISPAIDHRQDSAESTPLRAVPASPKADLFNTHTERNNAAEALLKLAFAGEPWESNPELNARFYAGFSQFMLGPSFAASLRLAAQKAFVSAPALLEHIYPAIEAAMRLAKDSVLSTDSATLSRGTLSIERLRRVNVKDRESALGVVALGQVLAAFDLLIGDGGVIPILRYSLAVAEPWYPELTLDPSLDPVTISTVFWDLVCALASHSVPSIKPITRHETRVDRLGGLCVSLMPLMYDLAVAVASITAARAAGQDQSDTDELESIEEKIAIWKPHLPSEFESSYNHHEKVRMRAQASMYRNACLLTAHRGRHAFGREDKSAKAFARDIIGDFNMYGVMLGRPDADCVGLRHIAFPLYTAALELPAEATACLDRIDLLNIAPTCLKSMVSIIEHVQSRRSSDMLLHSYLFEVLRNGNPTLIFVP